MPTLHSFQKVGSNRATPRLWLESERFGQLGFTPGARYSIVESATGALSFSISADGNRVVSQKRANGGIRPVMDLNSHALLARLADYDEVKIVGSHHRICVEPSRRAFAIRKHRDAVLDGQIPVFEFFAGAGTVSAAFHADPRFRVMGVCEIDPAFSGPYSRKHPNTPIYQMDIRDFDATELPTGAAVVFASLPCTDFSTAGVAKKGLKGRQELGSTGDLFIPLLAAVRHMMPLAVVVENVVPFGSSYAAAILTESLRRMGYHVSETTLEPHAEWGEIQDRRRYLMVATLDAPFSLATPGVRFAGTARDFLDAENAEQDAADAARIAGTVATLERHFAKHREMGHGFGYTTINRESTLIPTVTRSYHKINNGPFVETPHGLRMLRQGELERIFGCASGTDHYATSVEILGQGTLTRVFKGVVRQLADHLCKGERIASVAQAIEPKATTAIPEQGLLAL